MNAADPHKPLRDDVSMLGGMLGDTVREREGDAVFEIVERVRRLAKAARTRENHEVVPLEGRLHSLPLETAEPVARAFAHFLTLANIAEQHHRIRRRRDYLRGGARPQPGSFAEAFARLIDGGVAPEALARAAASMRVELVLTAHPTAITRRTLAMKHSRIADALARQDRADLTIPERDEILEELRREIAAMWGSDDVRPRRPTPMEEVRSGLFVFEQTVWDALPRYLRAFDAALRETTGHGLPLDAAPVTFGSWIGGDRDGNPAVTPAVTRDACREARAIASALYLRELEALGAELSVVDATRELRDRAGGAREPYRAVLRDLADRLRGSELRRPKDRGQTGVSRLRSSGASAGQGPGSDWGQSGVRLGSDWGQTGVRPGSDRGQTGVRPGSDWGQTRVEDESDPGLTPAELREPLELCHRSLVATGQQRLADGRLTDVLRRLAAFGRHLVRLDVRQHAERHAAAIDAIARHAGAGAYLEMDEAHRMAFLRRARAERLPIPADLPADEQVRDVLDTCRILAEIPADSLGAYVVSMTRAPSDVAAVEYLQQAFGSNLRVVPLFEEVATLETAGDTVRAILSAREQPTAPGPLPDAEAALPDREAGLPGSEATLPDSDASREAATAGRGFSRAGALEIMIGYSDSAKDGGRLAANWQLYKAQESVVAACRDAGVEVTLFHGRGGSIGRGGGPTHLAIQSQPPGSIDGRLRVTVQGEMIEAQLGLRDIAVRTLEVYTTSVLDATLAPPRAAPAAWRKTMDRLAGTAHGVYRDLVYDDPRFLQYFRAATPIDELGLVPIGSRPARRSSDGGVESLRAIPWVFAWTQTRLLLPSWLGTGEALDEAIGAGLLPQLREMIGGWPFLNSTLRLIEMALAETEPAIAEAYDRELVAGELQDVGEDLRRRLDLARRGVLQVLGAKTLLEENPVLRRSIDVRNPYVDPINIVQIALLSRLRGDETVEPALWQAFLVTVNGIAAGMRNVG